MPEGHKIEKTHPIVAKIKERVDAEYANGRCSVMGDDELDLMIMECDKDFHKNLLILGE